MAFLDMSDVITDPDFAEPADGTVLLVRSAQTVGGDGMASNAETVTPIGGVLCSTGGDIIRNAEAEIDSDSFVIHTLTPLTEGLAPDTPADVIVWRNSRYTVKSVNSFSNFGAGFYAANCELAPVQGPAQ